MEFPGPAPGEATARLEDGRLVLENSAIKAVWNVGDGPFRLLEVVDKLSQGTVRAGRHLESGPFMQLFDGTKFALGRVRLTEKPAIKRIEAEPGTLPAGRRVADGRQP